MGNSQSRKRQLLKGRRHWFEQTSDVALQTAREVQTFISGHAVAIDKEIIMPELERALKAGRMDPYQAVTILSANVIYHQNSKLDEKEYIKRAIFLYNAKSFEDICDAEDLKNKKDPLYLKISEIFNSASGSEKEKVSKAKFECFVQDILSGSSKKSLKRSALELFTSAANDNQFSKTDIAKILSWYNPHAVETETEKNKRFILNAKGEKVKTTSPFDINLIIRDLKSLKEKERITTTQTALLIHYFGHAMDRRKGMGQGYYTDHTMSVAELVQIRGYAYFGEDTEGVDELVWKASLVALLHDVGEGNENLDLSTLYGLLPDDVVDAVRLLHKPEDEHYFTYAEKVKANRLAKLVKMCDMIHNSSDVAEMARSTEPKKVKVFQKQTLIYPLTAEYFIFTENPDNTNVTFEEFAKSKAGGGINDTDFRTLEILAMSDVQREKENVTLEGRTIPQPVFDPVVENIFVKVADAKVSANDYAYTRRKENASLHGGANVRFGS